MNAILLLQKTKKVIKKSVPFYKKSYFCFLFVTFCKVAHTFLFVYVTILHSSTPLFLTSNPVEDAARANQSENQEKIPQSVLVE